MKLTRIINIYESELENFEEGSILKIKNGTSWSGENSQESFSNEWNKGIEVVIFFNNAKSEDFIKLTENDINDFDILECDISKYDEHRNNKDLLLKIIDFSDGREDVGYIEIVVDYN